MTYGLSTRAFIEDGPVEQVAKATPAASTARSWRALDEAAASRRSSRRFAPRTTASTAIPLAL